MTIIKFFLNLGLKMLKILPSLSFVIPPDIVSGATFIFSGIGYFLPINAIVALFSVKMIVITFRLVLAVLKIVKSFLPKL